MDDQTALTAKYPAKQLRRLFWIFLLLNIVYIVWSRNFLRPLDSGEIVKFEIAKEVPVAESIIREWTSGSGIKYTKAVQSIYIDYLFIILYVGGLAVAAHYFGMLTRHQLLIRTSRFFQFLLLGAGVCDVIENVAMWYSLHGHATNWNVTLAYDMAAVKFSIIILTLLFLFICLVFYVLRKIAKE